MKNNETLASGIVLCLMEILIGVLLLINPIGFTTGIIITVGIVVGLYGVYSVIKYIRTDALMAEREQTLAKGLIALAAGCFLTIKSHWVIVTFPVLTVLYGVAVLVVGLCKVQRTADMLRQHIPQWGWAALSAALALVFASVILTSPFSSTVVLWTFTAAALIVEAVVDAISLIVEHRRKDKV